MPLQNRVDPFGRLHASSARGTMMGNRGILHDGERNVIRAHAHQNWVACTLSYKDVSRRVMAPGNYTELFFLDEATALSAGHRPCATCRRARYQAFTEAWLAVHGGADEGRSLPQTIDRRLHAARFSRGIGKVTHQAEGLGLPDGTMIADGEEALLVWRGDTFAWSFDGYQNRGPVTAGQVTVLTPEPMLAVFRNGYEPAVHESIGANECLRDAPA